LRAALPDESPAPPSGNVEFQLIGRILFDFIHVTHNVFLSLCASPYAGRLDKGCPTKKYFKKFLIFSPTRFPASFPGFMLIAFNKPYGVVSQFTRDGSPNRTLAEFGFPARVYAIGRLDADSEGLLLLSDEAALNARLLQPSRAHPRVYWAQVERVPSEEALRKLSRGVMAQGRMTRPCRAWLLDPPPALPPRVPPIRQRKTVPDRWIALELVEGKNRQVRRMTAAVGHPTLRLFRAQIGEFQDTGLAPGQWRILDAQERALALGGAQKQVPIISRNSNKIEAAPRKRNWEGD
jgi:23S rRNA pseudouridine2457 synthase